jgi:hypothetical protein
MRLSSVGLLTHQPPPTGRTDIIAALESGRPPPWQSLVLRFIVPLHRRRANTDRPPLD